LLLPLVAPLPPVPVAPLKELPPLAPDSPDALPATALLLASGVFEPEQPNRESESETKPTSAVRMFRET
jgi:hypothetical protein